MQEKSGKRAAYVDSTLGLGGPSPLPPGARQLSQSELGQDDRLHHRRGIGASVENDEFPTLGSCSHVFLVSAIVASMMST